jgi:hypothetical protein
MSLALVVQDLAYALIAHLLDDFEAEVEFGGAAFLLAIVGDVLEDALYRGVQARREPSGRRLRAGATPRAKLRELPIRSRSASKTVRLRFDARLGPQRS